MSYPYEEVAEMIDAVTSAEGQPPTARSSGGGSVTVPNPTPRHGFRVTVEDLETGDKQAMIVHAGDYMLIPFAPCYLETTQAHGNGTHVITVKNHRPQDRPRQVPVGEVTGDRT